MNWHITPHNGMWRLTKAGSGRSTAEFHSRPFAITEAIHQAEKTGGVVYVHDWSGNVVCRIPNNLDDIEELSMNIEATSAAKVIDALVEDKTLRKATVFVSPFFVTKATRVHRHDGRDSRLQMVVTVGKPNYAEREFIKLAKKAGEPFPIKKIQLKFWPKKKPH